MHRGGGGFLSDIYVWRTVTIENYLHLHYFKLNMALADAGQPKQNKNNTIRQSRRRSIT